MGTNVVSGTAVAVVAATGDATCFGAMAKEIVGARPLTSFDKGISKVSWMLIRFLMVMTPLVFLINGIEKGDWLQSLLFAVSVAVGLTPEMLPMIVTTNLAKGAVTMARRKTIVSGSMPSRISARWMSFAPTRPARSPRTRSSLKGTSIFTVTRICACSNTPG